MHLLLWPLLDFGLSATAPHVPIMREMPERARTHWLRNTWAIQTDKDMEEKFYIRKVNKITFTGISTSLVTLWIFICFEKHNRIQLKFKMFDKLQYWPSSAEVIIYFKRQEKEDILPHMHRYWWDVLHGHSFEHVIHKSALKPAINRVPSAPEITMYPSRIQHIWYEIKLIFQTVDGQT